jgi:hypothetical protein
MYLLELEDDERAVLVELVERGLVDLAREVRRTESIDYRHALTEKEDCLQRLAERLRRVPVA